MYNDPLFDPSDLAKPDYRCAHDNFTGNPYGADYMCGMCESGLFAKSIVIQSPFSIYPEDFTMFKAVYGQDWTLKTKWGFFKGFMKAGKAHFRPMFKIVWDERMRIYIGRSMKIYIGPK